VGAQFLTLGLVSLADATKPAQARRSANRPSQVASPGLWLGENLHDLLRPQSALTIRPICALARDRHLCMRRRIPRAHDIKVENNRPLD
jgi:hypothetical protein